MSRRARSGVDASLTDEELLEAYVVGDDAESAFRMLVERHERRVYAICYRYFGDRSDAEDATQETFLRVARHAESFSGGSKLTTWLYRIAFNACHDAVRYRERRPQVPIEDVVAAADARDQHDALGWGPGDPLIAAETADRVQRALLRLDEVSRTLLILVALEGASYAEAAAALDLPVGTAKSRVHRARARLADLLAEGPAGTTRNPSSSGDVPRTGPRSVPDDRSDDAGGRP